MPLILEDRIRETTTVTGTSDATLLGAVTGFQAFSVIGNGNTTYYTISDQSGGNFEVGIGTFSSIGPTLARTTILSSSNGGSIVNFPAGTKDVFVTYPSEKAVYLDASGDVQPALGTVNATTVDTTNLEVTNLKAKDGTAAGSIANSTGVVTLGSSVLTTTDINGGTIDGTTVGASTASTGSFTSLTDSGNLTFTGTGNRILGDFNNATFANRVAFQTSTTNGNTSITALPNGTSVTSNFRTYGASDPTNTSFLDFASVGGVDSRFSSGITGTGTFLPLTIYTGGSERLRIDTSGNVGIGTSSPATRLDVGGGGEIRSTDGTVQTFIQSSLGGGGGYIGTRSNHFLQFRTNNADAMRITSAGNVGIGTSAPNGLLNIGTNGSATATPLALLAFSSSGLGTALNDMRYISEFGGTSGNNLRLMFALHRTVAGSDWTTSAWRIQPAVDSSFTGAGSNRGYVELATGSGGAYQGIGLSGSGNIAPDFVVNNAGNVGIGTSSPVSKLHVSGSTNAEVRVQNTSSGVNERAFLRVQSTSSSFGGAIVMTNAAESGYASSAMLVYNFDNQPLVFGTNNTERMRIDSSGNIGIGTSAPAARFQSTVNTNNGSIGVAAILDAGTQNPSVSGGGIVMNFRTNSGSSFFGAVGGYTDGTNYVTGLWGGAAASGVPALLVNSSGNVGIGTSSPLGKLKVTVGDFAPAASGNMNTGVIYEAGIGSRAINFGVNNTAGYSWINAAFSNNSGVADNLVIMTGTTERMRITAAGRVAINSSTAEAQLMVFGAGGAIGGANATNLGAIMINAGITAVNDNAGLEFKTSVFGAGFGHLINGVNVSGDGTALVFSNRQNSATWTEAMRISSSGNLLVGTTSNFSADKMCLNFTSAQNGFGVRDDSNSSGAFYAVFRNAANGIIGSITRVTTTDAVTYNTTSDYRLKTVIAPVINAGERIDALEPIEYDWNTGGHAKGFLAHKFAEVYPNSVSGEKDAVDAEGNPVYQAMQAATSEVMADLIAEIQSLRKRVAQLESK